ncbi:hypothetical protein [Nitrobacter sp. TKz-YC02]|uniref:hypothetical protein n=1 Tax=Nitrobacter sp. TKz-YC02 TaxID=3398704 RepID=UPI003CF16A35
MATRRRQAKADDGYTRDTFTQLRGAGSEDGESLDRWPAAAYMTAVKTWRELSPARSSSRWLLSAD